MALKKIPKENKGLPNLPQKVRNKMGYMKAGGTIQKKKIGGIIKAAKAVNKNKKNIKENKEFFNMLEKRDQMMKKGQNTETITKKIKKYRKDYEKLGLEGAKKPIKKSKGGVVSAGQGKVMKDRIKTTKMRKS